MSDQSILDDMISALRGALDDGYEIIKPFVETQGKLLAKQAQDIATSRAQGSLKDDDELFDFFLANLKTNTKNLAKHVAMLTLLTIEKAWNAMAEALWGGIRTILKAAGVPDQLLPQTPPHI